MDYQFDCLDRMFNPQNVAVIGVSTKGWGFGRGIMLSLKKIGFEGNLYPVNPKGGSINGIEIYRNVEDIPVPIDFAIIAVPGKMVPAALEQCRKKGAVGAEILSSGFKELGTTEGESLETEIEKAAAKGIRVIGPNCFGIYCPKSGLTFLPGPDLSREPGNLSFAAQSGGMSVDFAAIGKWLGLKFAKMVSFGNGVDLRETELLAYFEQDQETRIIAMYIEGVENGDTFFRALSSAASKKPVIILKGGLSESGSRAVASHTASLGGSRIIWQSILRQAGAVQVADAKELADACLGFSMLPWRMYKGISVVGGGGALGVAACDTAEAYGFELPPFSSDLAEKIAPYLPQPGSSAKNPIDVANPYVPPGQLKMTLITAAEDERIDVQILIQLFDHFKFLAETNGAALEDFAQYRGLADAVKETVEKTGKPVILVMPENRRSIEDMDIAALLREIRRTFIDQGIPVFDSLRDALFSLSQVSRYAEYVNGRKDAGERTATARSLEDNGKNNMALIIDTALSEGRQTLSEYESKQILAGYNIPVTGEILINSVDEAVTATRAIGYPVAVKGCSPLIAHKTESGLIHLNINNDRELTAVCETFLSKLGPEGSLMVQEMIKGERELVVGMNRDHQFGPCVMFGLGGIFTEIVSDVAFRKAPLSMKDAFDMLNEIRRHKILEATRGLPPVDREALIHILMAVGRIAISDERIREIDINPIIIQNGRPVAVDALIFLNT